MEILKIENLLKIYGKGDNIFLKWVIQKEKDTKYMVLDLWSENTAKMSRR